ncbi:MAG TPA: HIT domain-containing protein [Ktedonobacterales bacterium]|nr:HIT domain-containing protein [Ktedonobacterales bacterium]
MDCSVCPSVAGERRISPGATIYDGQFWMVEHAYPTTHPGWLVLVLKRHAEALHELSAAELAELGALQARTVRALAAVLRSQKEYIACYSEGEHFHHIHIHVVARPADLPPERRGPRSFSLLAVTPAEALPAERVRALCDALGAWFRADLAANPPA